MTKPRVHGDANIFSDIHRQLGAHRPLTDLDFISGEVISGFLRVGVCDDGEDRIYSEYAVNFEQAQARTTALFDFKHSLTEYIRYSLQTIKTGTALWYYAQMAKQLGARAFVVVASDGGLPLRFFEITTGEAVYKGELITDQPEGVKAFWADVLKL